MKSVVVCVVFLLSWLQGFPQEHYYGQDTRNNRVTILNDMDVKQDPRIDSLLLRHIRQNERRHGTDGYRVEIFFGSGARGRDEAFRKKTEFLKIFPDETAYMLFLSPDFKVRVGDCRTKSEALKLKAKISSHYPNSFIVPDIIQFPKLFSEERE